MEPTSTDAWTKKRSWGGRFGRQVSKIIRENMRYIQKYTTFNFFLLGFPANVTILVELLVYKNCCSIYCVGGWGLDPYYNSMVSFCCDPFSFPSISTPDKTLCVQLSLSLFKLSLFDPGTTWPANDVLVPCTTLALAQRMAWSCRPQWSGNTIQMKIQHFKKSFAEVSQSAWSGSFAKKISIPDAFLSWGRPIRTNWIIAHLDDLDHFQKGNSCAGLSL